LILRSDEQLASLDVAEVNLICAVGLPAGPSPAIIRGCLNKLKSWTALARRFTDSSRDEFFRPDPARYNNSEALFCSATLVAALQRHCGLRYNPTKIPAEAVFGAADSFIHGALLGEGGTCASMPVVVAAVGRRLGYPIKLVRAARDGHGHVFGRWDEPGGEKLNIEATAPNLGIPDDDDFRTGAWAMTPEMEKAGLFLKSLTPREELALFLGLRAWHWQLAKNWREAVEPLAWASILSPQNRVYSDTLDLYLKNWSDELKGLQPPGFPEFHYEPDDGLFPGLPQKQRYALLAMQALEHALTNPDWERKYWGPMRRGEYLHVLPRRIVARIAGGRASVSLEGGPNLSPVWTR
jgi:hypothetical protein